MGSGSRLGLDRAWPNERIQGGAGRAELSTREVSRLTSAPTPTQGVGVEKRIFLSGQAHLQHPRPTSHSPHMRPTLKARPGCAQSRGGGWTGLALTNPALWGVR